MESLLQTRAGGAVAVRKLNTKYDADGFIGLYRKAFAEPPWNENLEYSAVMKELLGYYNSIDLDIKVAVVQVERKSGAKGMLRTDSIVVGLSVAYRLDYKEFAFLSERLAEGLYAYGDELAVMKEWRNNGIARALITSREGFYRRLGYAGLVGRTNVNGPMVQVYEKLGFKNIGVQDPVYPERHYFEKRIDGI